MFYGQITGVFHSPPFSAPALDSDLLRRRPRGRLRPLQPDLQDLRQTGSALPRKAVPKPFQSATR